MMYRRFGFLHSRLLLQAQDRIRATRGQLDSLDSGDQEQSIGMNLMEARQFEQRKSLLNLVRQELSEYRT